MQVKKKTKKLTAKEFWKREGYSVAAMAVKNVRSMSRLTNLAARLGNIEGA